MEHKFSPIIPEPAKKETKAPLSPEKQQELARLKVEEKELLQIRADILRELKENEKELMQERASIERQLQENQNQLNQERFRRLAEEKKALFKSRIDQIKRLGEFGLKYLFERPIAALGVVGVTTAVAFGATNLASGPNKAQVESEFDKSRKTMEAPSVKEQKFNELLSQVKEKIDSNFFKTLSDSAQERYVSFIEKDLKEKNNPVVVDTSAESDSVEYDESDPKEADMLDLVGIVAAGGESGGDYSLPCSVGNACGKYQVIPSYWFDKIGLDPDDKEDKKYFMEHAEKQEEAWDTIYTTLHDKWGDKPELIFAGLLQTSTGPLKYGTKAGNEPEDAFGTSVNHYVNSKMPKYRELEKATSGGGRWLTDAKNQKLYWVDLSYHKKFEMDIHKLVPGDKNASYVAPVGEEEDVQVSKKLAQALNAQSRTVDYVAEHAKYSSKKLVSYKERKEMAKKKASARATVKKDSHKAGKGIVLTTQFPKNGV